MIIISIIVSADVVCKPGCCWLLIAVLCVDVQPRQNLLAAVGRIGEVSQEVLEEIGYSATDMDKAFQVWCWERMALIFSLQFGSLLCYTFLQSFCSAIMYNF